MNTNNVKLQLLILLFLSSCKFTFGQAYLTSLQLGDTFTVNINTGAYLDITKAGNVKNVRDYALPNPDQRRWENGTLFRIQIYFDKKDSIVIGMIISRAVESPVDIKEEFTNQLKFYRDEYCKKGMPGAKFVEENVRIDDGWHTDFFSYSIQNNKIMRTIIFPKKLMFPILYEESYLIHSRYKPDKTLRK